MTAKKKTKAKVNPSKAKITDCDDLTQGVKKIFEKGNQTKIKIKDSKGQFVYLNVPMTIAVIITLLLPFITILVVLLAMFGVLKLELFKENAKKAGD
jgi:hypothetical protein